MDRVYEKEKSSRRTTIDERHKDRESIKDHHNHHHHHHHRDHRDRDRDRDHRPRSGRDGPSSGDKERRHRTGRDIDDASRELEDREPKHRSRRSEERHHHGDNKHRDDDRHHRSREKSQDPTTDGREGSGEVRVLGEESVERRSSSLSSAYISNKRKERSESEDRSEKSDKRIRALSEVKREKRKFEHRDVEDDSRDLNGVVEGEKSEDGTKEEVTTRELNGGGSGREKRRERRRFEDRAKEEDTTGVGEEGKQFSGAKLEKNQPTNERENSNAEGVALNAGDSIANGAAAETLDSTSSVMPGNNPAFSHPPPTKVSSISTTNENKGVSVTRSHEVPGKSSTDVATTSAAGKSGSLSLDALAKAKKALQMQKELSEKLKKIPLLNKVANSTSDGNAQLGLNEGSKPPPSSTKTQHGSMHLTTTSMAAPAQASSSTPILPSPTSVSVMPSPGGMTALGGLTNAANYEAVKRAQELAAKMGFRHDPEFAPLINMFPGHVPTEMTAPQKPAKAPVLRLDALGREIDEHGNVINMPKPTNLSTLKVNINKQKKEAFQILKPELDVDPDSNPHFDAGMGINKTKLLRPKRMSFQFVEEGKWSKEADRMKNKSEAQAKELKIKQAQLAKAKAEPYINPNLIEVSERVITKEKPKDPIPDVEWWDVALLPSGTYGEITEETTIEYRLKMDKITIYVEHPLPIEPPAEPAPPPPQPLKLTKKEQKKLRTQRRLAKEKDRQEMIRQGLIEPPKPKVKMSNLMKVLGSEATQDPTRLEMEIRTAAAEREQAHVDRNIARKLTPAERREKKERKLFEDPNTLETIVSVYKINDLSHPQTRFKVDVNAQENRLTGCAVITDDMCVVAVEGGTKPIKRYNKLMLKRINWAAAVVNEEEEEEDDKKPVNKCSLVWQGSVAKSSFNRFSVHQCITEAAARKVFSDAGVGHYWDLAVNFTGDDEI